MLRPNPALADGIDQRPDGEQGEAGGLDRSDGIGIRIDRLDGGEKLLAENAADSAAESKRRTGFFSMRLSPEAMFFPTAYMDMLRTVQPERKLMVDTLAKPKRSSTGLMITPPPMPQTAPMREARELTIR